MSHWIYINIPEQKMALVQGGTVQQSYPISSALKGLGECKNSYQTPRGWHTVRAKIGHGLPLNAVFVGRRFTGEVYTPALGVQYPQRDWILTRILWLSGSEKGVNRLGQVDTFQRYIYIHGTADEEGIGQPRSHGCIRMKNADILTVFDTIPVHAPVYIGAQPLDEVWINAKHNLD